MEATVDDGSATTSSFQTTLPSSVNDYYNDDTLVFISGSLIGQSRIIADYDGDNLQVTFDEPFTSAPADSDEFILLAGHNLTLTQIQNTVWDAPTSAHPIPGSTGKALQDASVETQNAYVLPISTSDPCAPRGTALTAFINGAATFVLEFKDASGAIIDPTLEALYFVVEDGSTGTDMVVIPDGSLTKTTKNISVTVPASDNTPIGSYRWAVRTETNEKVLGYGVYNIQYAAQDDSP